MSKPKSFRRKAPRVRGPRLAGPRRRMTITALAVAGVLLASSGAWAYHEVTRQPSAASIPADPLMIQAPEQESLSGLLPRDTAVYARLTCDGALVSFLNHGLAGLGFGSLADAMPFTRFLLPGLHAMAGYPLVLDSDGNLGDTSSLGNLGSQRMQQLVGAIARQVDRDVALALYPPTRNTSGPMGISLVARAKDPAETQRLVNELKGLLPGTRAVDGLFVDRDQIWVSNAPPLDEGLQDDGDFKRSLAHLPEDRFGTLYVNGPRLRELADGYQHFLSGGGEIGESLLSPMAGLMGDPAMRDLLTSLDQERALDQHLATCATHRLGLLQGFTYTDWKPRDPEGLKRKAAAVLQASSARGWETLSGTNVRGQMQERPKAANPTEALSMVKDLLGN